MELVELRRLAESAIDPDTWTSDGLGAIYELAASVRARIEDLSGSELQATGLQLLDRCGIQ